MQKGFTLIETLVAITILLIAIAGPLTIAAKGLTSSYYSRDQITAFYLAQEGIEYIRNLRDTSSIIRTKSATPDRNTWMNFLSPNNPLNDDILSKCSGGSVCDIDTKNGTVDICPATGCVLKISGTDPDTFYDHVGSKVSNYTRKISLTPVANNGLNDEYVVTVTVTWKSSLPNNTFTVSEDITNWQN